MERWVAVSDEPGLVATRPALDTKPAARNALPLRRRARAFDERTLRTLMIVVPQISSAFSNIGLVNHLRESETKYRTLVAGMQDVVYICDRHWSILDANPAANVAVRRPNCRKNSDGIVCSPNTASQFVESVRTSRASQNFETELLNTATINLVTLLSCVTDGERYSGIIKDMTERTRLMEQVSRAQKMESIGTLASGVAHDFNNILGIILPNAELIKMKIDSESMVAMLRGVIIECVAAAGIDKAIALTVSERSRFAAA